MAWYNDYRPSKFVEVVGQNMIKTVLQNTIEQSKTHDGKNKIKHGYLLSGPKGVGKTTIARIFAGELNDLLNNPQAKMDIVELDAASNTGVDSIRQLIDSANTPPFAGKYKIFIIDEVHMLSKSAMSALLKILEEPPSYLIFLLATTNPEKLIPTLLSRLTKLALTSHTTEDIVGQLSMISGNEKMNIDQESLQLIAKRAGGGQRDAINLLETLSSYSLEHYSIKETSNLLGLVSSEIFDRISTIFLSQDFGSITTMIQELENLGLDGEAFLAQFLDYLLEQVFTNPNQSQSLILPVASILNMKLPINTVLSSFALVQAELTKNTFVRSMPPQIINTQSLKNQTEQGLTEKKSPKIVERDEVEIVETKIFQSVKIVESSPEVETSLESKHDLVMSKEEGDLKEERSLDQEVEVPQEGDDESGFFDDGFFEQQLEVENHQEVLDKNSSQISAENQTQNPTEELTDEIEKNNSIEQVVVTSTIIDNAQITTQLGILDPIVVKSMLPALTKLPSCPPTMKMLITDINVESTDNNLIVFSISSPIFLPQLKNPKAIDFLTGQFQEKYGPATKVDVILRDPSLKNPAQKPIKQPDLQSSFGNGDDSGQKSSNMSQSNSDNTRIETPKPNQPPLQSNTKPSEIFYKVYGDSMPPNNISDTSKMKFYKDKIEFPVTNTIDIDSSDWNDEISGVFDF
jgi:DNA polymerase III subunit gamma/tau